MNSSQYTVYILKTSRNTYYIGQTRQLAVRLRQHQEKKGARYMRMCSSFVLVHTEVYPTRSEALKRELMLKKLTKTQKEDYIQTGILPASFFKKNE
jgi:putative endonuclease